VIAASLVVELDKDDLGAHLPLTIGRHYRKELHLAPILAHELQLLLVADS